MNEQTRALLNLSIKKDIIYGIIISIIISAFLGIRVSFIFLLGIIIAMLNFSLSGIILDKSLNDGVNRRIFIILGSIIRVLCVAIIAIPFSSNIIYLLAYLGGFIIHFPILIISYIKKQKGSD